MAMTATSCFRWMCIFISTMLRCNMLQRIGPRIVSAFSVSPFQHGARPPEASSVHPHSFLMLVTTKQLPAGCHLFSTHTDNPEEEDTIFALSSGSLAAGGGATGVLPGSCHFIQHDLQQTTPEATNGQCPKFDRLLHKYSARSSTRTTI